MAGSGSNPSDIFDVRKIRKLVELMNDHDLSVIDLKQGDQRIRLRRGNDQVVTIGPGATPLAPAPVSAPVAATENSAAGTASGGSAAGDANAIFIKSPMVGTFYAASNPESASFVKVGDHVGPDSTVCIIEAMKVFNEIPAEVSGQIEAVLVENGDPVEYDQPLFRIAAP